MSSSWNMNAFKGTRSHKRVLSHHCLYPILYKRTDFNLTFNMSTILYNYLHNDNNLTVVGNIILIKIIFCINLNKYRIDNYLFAFQN